MNAVIDWALERNRTALSIFLFCLLAGIFSYRMIPVELEPNIQVPVVVITVPHQGISPEDAERLLVLPIETELRSLEGIEEVRSYGAEGVATVVVEFEIGHKTPLIDISEAMDRAKAKIPSTAEEPLIDSISTVDFPAVVVNFSGANVPERTLYKLAVNLKEGLEQQSGVLEAKLVGEREEVLEVELNQLLMESRSISYEEVLNNILLNNRLVAAGFIDNGAGRFSVKVPAVIETYEDLYNIPVRTVGETVLTLGEIANIRRTFKDRSSFARVNGQPSISVEVVKRVNANMIDTVAEAKALVESERDSYPSQVRVTYTTDQAPDALRQVNELKGNILTAMVLVMILVVAALGLRGGMLVGVGIPLSFLFGCITLQAIGYTFNFMVMFGLLLALGMLIDGAIVVVEYADRKMMEGADRKLAYSMAAKRMFWPVTASVSTTLAAFLPLFFWPGVSGKFMLHLPVTVSAVMLGSLAYALFFAPVLGSIFGKAGSQDARRLRNTMILEEGDPRTLKNFSGAYARLLSVVTRWPLTVFLVTVSILVAAFSLYGRFGGGVVFFTDQDPTFATVSVNARGNMSAQERHDLVLEVENEILPIPGIKSLYTAVVNASGASNRGRSAADRIGYFFVEMHEPQYRESTGEEILELIRQRGARLVGVQVEVKKMEGGPPVGKPVQIQFSSKYGELLEPLVGQVREHVDGVEGLRDVEDTRTLPGIQWELVVDRAKAARFGANVTMVGYAVQMVTNGIKISEYQPDDALEGIDIRARFPSEQRGLQALGDLRITTPRGQVPISSFVSLRPNQKVDTVQRIDGFRVEFVRADVAPGVLADTKVKEIRAWLDQQSFDPRVDVKFRGSNEEQEQAGAFLGVAFSMALLLMFVLLVTQFNSFYQSILIMFAVIMSTAGVLIGLLVLGQPFSVILTGVGIVALAGIVVNNNIVLIDTYNHVRRKCPELSSRDAMIRAGAQRLRPVVLTTVTTVLGLLPLAMQMSIDLVESQVTVASSITAFWAPLASAIVSGLIFSTFLTLICTPAMITLPGRLGAIVSPVVRLGAWAGSAVSSRLRLPGSDQTEEKESPAAT